MSKTYDLHIQQGSAFSFVARWEAPPFIYKAIQSITAAAPAVVGCTGHGVPDGWPVALVSVQGMTQINTKLGVDGQPRVSAFVKATVRDSNTLELNTVNAAEFDAYTSGGYIQYYTPVDLTGYTGKVVIKDKVGGTVLVTLTEGAGVTTDAINHTITVSISALDSAGYTWTQGAYYLEMTPPSGAAFAEVIMQGDVFVSVEGA